MSFTSDLKDFQLKFAEASDKIVSGVEISLYSAVILDTPVGNPDLWLYNRGTKEEPDYVDYIAYMGYPEGYVGGRLRGNWQVSLDAPAAEQSLLTTDKSGRNTVSTMTAFIRGLSGGRVTYLTNNLAYAMPVEYGWSTQAPEGMVRKNVTRFQALVDQEAAKHKL